MTSYPTLNPRVFKSVPERKQAAQQEDGGELGVSPNTASPGQEFAAGFMCNQFIQLPEERVKSVDDIMA